MIRESFAWGDLLFPFFLIVICLAHGWTQELIFFVVYQKEL